MLIINNGVPKTGSTWIQRIVRTIARPGFPAGKWRSPSTNPSVKEELLKAYVDSGEWAEGYTLIKQHIPYSDALSYLAAEGIRVLVTYRDLPDAVVSWFHHCERQGKTRRGDIGAWLQGSGRNFAARSVRHRESWRGQPNARLIRYEDMLADAPGEIHRIMGFLGHPGTPDLAQAVARKTQVTLPPDAPLREGHHIRTGGRKVAQDELPEDFYRELVELQRATEDGRGSEEVLAAFIAAGKAGRRGKAGRARQAG